MEDDEAFTGKAAPKNPRASARGKLRRRLMWLQASLHEVELTIEEVFSAPGKTYKKEELERITTAIADFRNVTGLTGDGLPQISPISNEALERALFGLGDSLAPYEANTAPLIASIGLAKDDDPE
ncbi:hypothetical protein [Aestuariivirga sp.]|uniref:hypothetical protein n=1 Tax=Aestuariivirga sp. TaxID=2650926 RepID=UPI00391BC2B4